MKKKILFIILPIITMILVVSAVITVLYLHDNKSVGSAWGDTYYAYLKEAINEKDSNVAEQKYGTKLDMSDAKIQFCEVINDENPAMIMKYNKEDNQYINIYQIDNESKVVYIAFKQSANIEYLYNIEKGKYDWYIHEDGPKSDSYCSLENVVTNLKDSSKKSEKSNMINIAEIHTDYAIRKDEENVQQETVSGTTLTANKWDSIFVNPEIEPNKSIDFKVDMNEKDLKKSMMSAVKEYKKDSEKLTDDIKDEVQIYANESKMKYQELETAKKELEAKRAAEEEANRSLKIGEFTLKFGKYIGEDASAGSTLILNKDGTCEYTTNWYDGENTKTFTYQVGEYNFAQDVVPDYRPGIALLTEEGGTVAQFMPTDNTILVDGDIGFYRYSEDNVNELNSSTQNQTNTDKLTQFELDENANINVPEGEYTRLNSDVHTGSVIIKNSTGHSFDFVFDCIYVSASGTPNVGHLEGTAKATKEGNFVFSEHVDGQYGYDYNVFFNKNEEGNFIVTDECFKLDGTWSVRPYAGMNVTFEGEYAKK